MSLLGEIFGYDPSGHDILGSHQDENNNCPVCGMSAVLHSQQHQAECIGKLFSPASEKGSK